MSYNIIQLHTKRDAFGAYQYEIRDGDHVVAFYCHDSRGDEHYIEFADGRKEMWPVGQMKDFLNGGGPQPLKLSAKAIAYLKDKLQRN